MSITPEKLDAWKREADKGNKEAQCTVGAYYETKGDYPTALYWYRLAAEQNEPKAQYRLGRLLLIERVSGNTSQAADEGMHWLCCARLAGIPEATDLLNQLLDRYGDSWYDYFQNVTNDIKRNASTHGVKYISHISQGGASGGCYIASAVYGSYDCPQVWVLRRFRDYKLAKTWYGRVFIRSYYAISPTFVKWFGRTSWFINLWKPRLDIMVKSLKNEGFDDTPYKDQNFSKNGK